MVAKAQTKPRIYKVSDKWRVSDGRSYGIGSTVKLAWWSYQMDRSTNRYLEDPYGFLGFKKRKCWQLW